MFFFVDDDDDAKKSSHFLQVPDAGVHKLANITVYCVIV